MDAFLVQAKELWVANWPRLAAAIAILVVGWIAIGILVPWIRRALNAAKIDVGLAGFLASLARMGLWVIVVISALGKLGVETTTFAAIVGAAGLAIALSLQGSLGNLAAGVIILFFKPFSIGHYIQAGGASGTVKGIAIFSTTLSTPDNVKIVVPNSAIIGGNITNYSANDTRRVDLVFGIGYDDDLEKAKTILQEMIDADERILPEPAPVIAVLELADSSVNIGVRPWVAASDYWGFYWDFLEQVKLRFDAEGISIPFPQRDVHLHQVA